LEIRNQKSSIGFTLIEMVAAVALVILIAGVALPSIVSLFKAGSDAQAYNLLAGQLTAARALAIAEGTYAGVHVQLADPTVNTKLAGTCWSAVVIYRDDEDVDKKFVLAEGFIPQRMPGNMAFGEPTNNPTDLDDFTSLTVVFSPSGAVVTQVAGANIDFNDTDPLFDATDPRRLWDIGIANDEQGISALTMFDYVQLRARSGSAQWEAYLNEAGQLIPINVYTGQLFPRR